MISECVNCVKPYVILKRQIRRFLEHYLLRMAACAAAKRAIGTRNGEQET